MKSIHAKTLSTNSQGEHNAAPEQVMRTARERACATRSRRPGDMPAPDRKPAAATSARRLAISLDSSASRYSSCPSSSAMPHETIRQSPCSSLTDNAFYSLVMCHLLLLQVTAVFSFILPHFSLLHCPSRLPIGSYPTCLAWAWLSCAEADPLSWAKRCMLACENCLERLGAAGADVLLWTDRPRGKPHSPLAHTLVLMALVLPNIWFYLQGLLYILYSLYS